MKNTAARSLLVLALVVAASLGALVAAALLTRSADIRSVDSKFERQGCDIINRQVTGLRLQLRTTRQFAAFDSSAELRAFHHGLIPSRKTSLASAVAAQRRGHCLPPDETRQP